MAKGVERRQADTSPTKEVVVQSLTKDATTQACLFDLVDNAIDGAREVIEAGGGKTKTKPIDLPSSYKGYKVDLRVSGSEVRVEDNASGISADDLEKSVLRFGQRAGRPHGIGFYGVGLNRALFKLGRTVKIDTDDGKSHSLIGFDVDDYLKEATTWERPFDVTASTGKRGTTITLTNPAPEISRELAGSDEILRRDLGRRYHRFLQKGLKILFQGKPVEPLYIPLRGNSPFPRLHKSYRSGDNVWIHIEAGEHRDHLFPAEMAEGSANPPELTRDFGWSVLCNDREIVEADRTDKTGWEHTWHPEYNGFVGRVHFVSSAPDLLPWNTSKTDVDRNNAAYQRALEDMQAFAAKWRQYTRAAKTAKRKGLLLPVPGPRKGVESAPSAKSNSRRPKAKMRQHSRWLLPADIDEGKCSGKLLELVGEGKSIDAFENRYTGLALMRILFEVASVHFLKRAKLLEPCRAWCIAKEEAARAKAYSADHKKRYVPALSILLDYFTAHWEPTFGPAAGAYLEPSFNKFKQFKSDMDSAVHHPFNEINAIRAIEMRDSCIPILRHLLET
ncbi:MAG TPA: ATP-binding protein [Chthoniobacterales bacterium]|jgi:hypothetical protein